MVIILATIGVIGVITSMYNIVMIAILFKTKSQIKYKQIKTKK